MPRAVCTVYSGKVDLGTGVRTALRQIAAEELDVPLRPGRSDPRRHRADAGAGHDLGQPVDPGGRRADAAGVGGGQGALLDEAAKRLGVARREPDRARTASISAGGKRVTYAELIGGKSFAIKLDPEAPVRPRTRRIYKIVGKPVPRVDIPGKVTGAFTYMQDFRAAGHAARPRGAAAGMGATLAERGRRLDQGHPGTAKVVRQGNFLAVVAENEWAAIKAAARAKAAWSKWEGLPEQAKLCEHVRATKVAKDEVTSNVGDTAAAMARRA